MNQQQYAGQSATLQSQYQSGDGQRYSPARQGGGRVSEQAFASTDGPVKTPL